MKKVLIQRIETSDEGCFGVLGVDDGEFECSTAELAWRDLDGDGKSDPSISCIPAGNYVCKWTESAHRKNADGTPEWSYQVMDVPGREGIRIHVGNFAGDKSRGYASDVLGCVVLGNNVSEMDIPLKKKEAHPEINRAKQRGVVSSRATIESFVTHMNKEDFELMITEGFKDVV